MTGNMRRTSGRIQMVMNVIRFATQLLNTCAITQSPDYYSVYTVHAKAKEIK